jgi:hypothetical protein
VPLLAAGPHNQRPVMRVPQTGLLATAAGRNCTWLAPVMLGCTDASTYGTVCQTVVLRSGKTVGRVMLL